MNPEDLLSTKTSNIPIKDMLESIRSELLEEYPSASSLIFIEYKDDTPFSLFGQVGVVFYHPNIVKKVPRHFIEETLRQIFEIFDDQFETIIDTLH